MEIIKSARLKNLFLFGVTVIAMLGLVEASLRVLGYPEEPVHPDKVFDPVLLYRIPGNFPGVDADGFRNLSIPRQSDIVTLGDSHTYGYNVTREYTWPSEIAKLTGLSNYNLGRGGYGPLQYYYLFDRALELKPRHVIVGLFPANDIKGVCDPYLKTSYWKTRVKQENLDLGYCDEVASGHASRKKNKHEKLAGLMDKASSWLFQTKTANLLLLGTSQMRSLLPFDTRGVVSFNDGKNRTIMHNGDIRRHSNYTDLTRKEIKNSLVITKELLSRMANRTRRSGAEFAVLVIPSKEYMLFTHARKIGRDMPDIYARAAANEEKLNADLLSWLQESGIPAAYAKDELEALLSGSGGVYPPTNDGHPVAAGYKAYAQALYKVYFARQTH